MTALVLAFVMTPVLVHGLGKDAYGVWVLVGSTVLYFDLLKFGLGRAVVKYVAEGEELDDLDLLRRTITTSFGVLLVPGAFFLLISPGLAFLFTAIFNVPHGLETAALISVILVGIDLAVAIPADSFGSSLVGLQRFDYLQLTIVVTAVCQAVGWAVVLALGGGIVALGVVTLAFSLTSQVARYALVKRLVPGIRIAPRYFDRSLVRPLMSLSGWIAMTDFSEVVINRIDTIIVGAVVGVPEAGVYAVGQKLAGLGSRFSLPAVIMFFPHSSALAAAGDRRGLSRAVTTGTRIAVGISAPLTVGLVILAQPAISAWVGPGFGQATLVVVYLALAGLVTSVTAAGTYVLRGSGVVRVPALINSAEAVLNFALSVALALTMGLVGVALATLIAAVVTQLVALLPYVCRQTNTSLFALSRRLVVSLALPVAIAGGVAVSLRELGLESVPQVIGAGVAVMAAYGLVALMTVLSPHERRLLRDRLASRPAPPRLGRRRILLVDPSSRGGIAKYTLLVARALRTADACPKILGSVALEEPSAGVPVLRRLPVERWGKPEGAGPVFYARRLWAWTRSARLVLREVKRGRPDVVHFQAPLNRRLDHLLLARVRRRAPVVWTAHDVLPYERTDDDRDRFGRLYRSVDAVVVHSTLAAEQVKELADVDATVIAHPVPPIAAPIGKAAARRSLGLPESERILGAVGFIRAYKGYGLLAEVWERLGRDAPLLLVMGELLGREESAVVERLRCLERVDLRLGYAADSELNAAVAASDALLLPYVEASDSGVLHLARAAGVPVIASDAPQLAASVESARAGIVVRRSVEEWASTVTGELPPAPAPAPPLEATGRAHLALYEDVLGRTTAPREGGRSLTLATYTDATEIGGAERVLASLLGALDERILVTVMGVDPTVVDWVAAGRPSAATLLLPPVPDKSHAGPIVEHVRALRRLRPDVLHVNLRHPWSCQYAVLAGLLSRGTRVIAVEHLPIPSQAHFQRWAKRRLSRRLAAHVAVSVSSARTVEELVGLPKGSVLPIHNGIDSTPAGELPIPLDGAVIGAIGRLSTQKGYDMLLRVLPGLPGVTCVLVGDGPEGDDLRRLACDLGLEERVIFTGWRDEAEVGALLSRFTILAVPSRHEGFPLVVLEAMLAGVPVVAFDVGGIGEAVIDGETGALVPAGELEAFRAALTRLLHDPEARSAISARARELARTRYSVASMARAYECLYAEITA